MNTRTFYVCPPVHYEALYSNAWTRHGVHINRPRAMIQWSQMVSTLIMLDVHVVPISPPLMIGEQVFLGDLFFILDDILVRSNPAHPRKRREVMETFRYLEPVLQGVSRVWDVPPVTHFEGNADLLNYRNGLIAGVGERSRQEAYQALAQELDMEIHTVQLQAYGGTQFYHLDTALLPARHTLLYFPKAFTEQSRKALEALGPAIELTVEEATSLAANSLVIGDAVITSKLSPLFSSRMRGLGYRVIELDLTEFHKAGASVKCLTLEHYNLKGV